MSRLILIPPSYNMIEFVADRIDLSTRDFSNYVVVFPGRRPAHFLRKELSNRIKGGFVPPRIFSMDDFVDFLYEEHLAYHRRRIDSLDAVAILYEIHREFSKPIGGEGFLSPESFLALGTRIFRDIEECLIENISPEQVKMVDHSVTDMIPDESIGKLQALSHFYKEFYVRLQEMNLSTRSVRYTTVAQELEALPKEINIILAGFLALTKTEEKLFKRLDELSDILLVMQKTVRFDDLFQRLKKIFSKVDELMDDNPADPEIELYSSPDRHGQIFVVAEKIKKLKESGQIGENSVIVLPSPDGLVPLLHHCLSLLDQDQYNISMGYPLFRTPIFAFFTSLMDLILSMSDDNVYIPDYTRFVLHPYTKNIYFNPSESAGADITRAMFHALEGAFQNKRVVFMRLDEIENMALSCAENILSDLEVPKESLRDHIRNIHDHTIRKFMNFSSVRELSERAADVLMYIYKNSTALYHPLFYPFSEGFLKAFDSLKLSLFGTISFEDLSGYFQFLKRYLRSCTIPFEGTPLRGLQVLGFLETRNLKFDRVYLIDVNEGILPESKKDDSVLPQKARQMLGLTTYKDRERLSAAYFDLLIQGAREVHICFVENDRNEKSRFVERLLWERQKMEGRTDTEGFVRSIQYNVKLDNKDPETVEKTKEVLQVLRDFSFSASSLDDYLICPLRFYYRHILRLDRYREIDSEMERSDIGTIVHSILREYFEKRKGRKLTKENLTIEDMDAIVERRFRDYYGGATSGSLYMLKRQMKRRLEELIRDYYHEMLDRNISITTVAVEKRLESNLNGFFIKGSIDKIEKREGATDKALVIIDYKISASDRHLRIRFDKLDPAQRSSWPEAIGSLQIPFYMTLYEKVYGERPDGVYLLLGRGRMNIASEVWVVEGQKEYNIIKEIILRLMEEILTPSVNFGSTSNKRENCPICQFQELCGMRWIRKSGY